MLSAFTASVMALCFLIAGWFFRNDGIYYENNKQFGRAKILGYEHHDQSRVSSYFVSLLDIGDENTYICSGHGLKTEKYPIGTVIEVEFARGKKFGVSYTEVHFANALPPDRCKIGKVFLDIAAELFVGAIVLFLFGFANLLL